MPKPCPYFSVFNLLDDTLREIGLYVGRKNFSAYFLAGRVCSYCRPQGLASHAKRIPSPLCHGWNGVLSDEHFSVDVHLHFEHLH